jgi:hypothetical protein
MVLFGASPEDAPAADNKIYSHIDQLVSFLYSSETTRFNIALGAGVSPLEHRKIPALSQLMHDEWNNSNADKVFTEALTWSMCFGSCFVKLVVNDKSIHPFVLDPGSVGVLREDVGALDRQQALAHTYYMTKHDLFDRLYSHPKRDSIVEPDYQFSISTIDNS